MFHQRKQGPDESVDEYAQELRKLFYKAYPPTYHGTPEAELLGKSVLSNQFVAGLKTGLHKKLTGVEGNFEELVCKARFEEAKWKKTSAGRRKNQGDKKIPKKSGEESEEKSKRKRGYQCHRCGSTQHFIRDCPFKGRGASREAKGTEREATSNVKNLSFSSEEPDTTEENNSGGGLAVKPGPRVTTTVEVNGVECAAVVDTGSPVTIVSEECLLKVWKMMKPDLTNEERQEDVISNCRPATVTLRTYTDARVPNVAEIEVELKNRLKVMKTVLIVQKDAPQELLLGTDTLRSLGFSMELKELPESCGQGDGQEAVIRLIRATRIPARHAMLVEGDVGKAGNSGAPVPVVIEGECPADGLFVEFILVEAENGRTMVCLRNEGMAPVTLEEGTELGRAEEAIVVPEEEVSLDDVNVLSFL